MNLFSSSFFFGGGVGAGGVDCYCFWGDYYLNCAWGQGGGWVGVGGERGNGLKQEGEVLVKS